MSTLFYLSSAQMDVIRPFFPRSRGIPRRDDQKIISGIIHVLKFGLRWKDAPKEYGPYKTLYNRFVRWSNMGVFEKIFTALSESTQDTSLLMIDATCLKAHRTAASLRKKRASSRCIGRTKGGLNTKLHVVCDFDGRSIRTLLTAGSISDYGGAACLLPTLPSTRILLADRGYDAGWIRSFLKNRGCTPCIPSRKNTRVMSITTRNNISSITR